MGPASSRPGTGQGGWCDIVVDTNMTSKPGNILKFSSPLKYLLLSISLILSALVAGTLCTIESALPFEEDSTNTLDWSQAVQGCPGHTAACSGKRISEGSSVLPVCMISSSAHDFQMSQVLCVC